MHKPFDITTKQIVDTDPLAWVRFLGLPGESAELVDTDIALTAQADRLIRVAGGVDPYLLHLELQASYQKGKVDDAHFYNVSAKRTHKLPVRSTIILLRREADGPAMSGISEDISTTFRFGVVKMWEIDPKIFLNGPVSMLPLAVVADVTASTVPDVITRLTRRIEAEVPAVDRSTTWLEVMLLLGLNYDREFARAMVAGVRNMRESSTYQWIIEEGLAEGRELGLAEGRAEGRAEGERTLLLMLGSKRFGDPDPATRAAIDQIDSPERLETLALRLFEVETWEELLKG